MRLGKNPDFSLKNGRNPSLSELSAEMGIETEKIAEAIASSRPTESLSYWDSESGEKQIPTEGIEEKLTESISLKQAIESLSEEEKRIIALRYYNNKTQKETAEIIGSSQVQVSRKEKKILLYMRGVL